MRLDPSDLSVGVFRLQLFKRSETFITMQAQALRRYNPLYIGRTTFGPAPKGAASVEFGSSFAGKMAMLTGSPKPAVAKLGRQRVDLLHAHFGVDGVYALNVARRLKVPLITTLHGFDVTTSDVEFLKSGRPALINYVLKRRELVRSGDLFICVSEFIRQKALEKGYPPDRTVVHYIGNPSVEAKKISRGESSERPLSIVHVARLVEKKGTIYLMEAVARLRALGIPVSAEIIGDGPMMAGLTARRDDLRLMDMVHFSGARPHDEVLQRIAAADVLVLPSVTASSGDAEGLGMVLLEAAARGIPIVATRSGGIPEAVLDGETGLLVEERNSDQLSRALETLYRDPELRRRLGAKAVAHVRSFFNLDQQTLLLEELYDRVKVNYGRG